MEKKITAFECEEKENLYKLKRNIWITKNGIFHSTKKENLDKWKWNSLFSENGIVQIDKNGNSRKKVGLDFATAFQKKESLLQTPTSSGWHFSNRKLAIGKQKAHLKASQLWLKPSKWNPNICQQNAAPHSQFLIPTWPPTLSPSSTNHFPLPQYLLSAYFKFSSVLQQSSQHQFPIKKGMWPLQCQRLCLLTHLFDFLTLF